jgi:hypothetical protein
MKQQFFFVCMLVCSALLVLISCNARYLELKPEEEEADFSQMERVDISKNSLEKKAGDTLYNGYGQISKYKSFVKKTALLEFPVQLFEPGFEYRIDVVGTSESGPYRAQLSDVVSNTSTHPLRKNKSLYIQRGMIAAGIESLILYATANSQDTARVCVKFWKSKVRYASQVAVPLSQYVHFAQQRAGAPLAGKGSGLNTLLHSLHLQQPTQASLIPDSTNLWALHTQLAQQDAGYVSNNTATLLQLQQLAADKGVTYTLFSGDADDLAQAIQDGLSAGRGSIVPVMRDDSSPGNLAVASGKKHHILITGLAVGPDGQGIVFYKDCRTVDSETRITTIDWLVSSNQATTGGGSNTALW